MWHQSNDDICYCIILGPSKCTCIYHLLCAFAFRNLEILLLPILMCLSIFYDSCYSSECIMVFLSVKKNRECFTKMFYMSKTYGGNETCRISGWGFCCCFIYFFFIPSCKYFNFFFFFFERGDFTINQPSRRIHVDDDDDGKT